jgi:UPF0716 protein FxsA
MFLLAFLVLPIAEVFVFIEVGLAIGWLWAVVLLAGISLLGAWLLRIEGRLTIERVARAVSERRAPGPAGIDGALGLLGCALLAVPGFITDAVGALLLLPPTRVLVRRWISRRYEQSVMRWAARVGRYAPGGRGVRPADIDSTAVDDEWDQLPR